MKCIRAYTSNSKGFVFVRQKVAEYINQRDQIDDADPNHIYLTNGASEGVRQALSMLITSANDGIMIPIP